MVSAVLSDLDEGDLDIEWEARHATDDDLRACPAPTLHARDPHYMGLWAVDFVRPDGIHFICTVNLDNPNGEATRRIIDTARGLALDMTGELRPRCPKHSHHALGCKTKTILTRVSPESHTTRTKVVWVCPGGFKGSTQLLGEHMRLFWTEEVAKWESHI